VNKTKLIGLIGQLDDNIYSALHCDLKVVVCSFSSFHQTQTDHGTFSILSKVINSRAIYSTTSKKDSKLNQIE